MRRGGLLPGVGGRSSCINCFGGVFGCLRSSADSRVVSSKSNLVSQSSGAASTALRNSSSARLSQPRRASGFSSTMAFWKNAHADQKFGDASRRRLLREIDHFVVAFQAVERPEVVADRAVVFGGTICFAAGSASKRASAIW